MVGLAYALVLAVAFWLLRKRWPFHGAAFLMYVLLYFAGTFLLASMRGDETVHLGPWRLGQWIDLLLATSAAASLLILWWRTPQDPTGSENNRGFSENRGHRGGEQGAET